MNAKCQNFFLAVAAANDETKLNAHTDRNTIYLNAFILVWMGYCMWLVIVLFGLWEIRSEPKNSISRFYARIGVRTSSSLNECETFFFSTFAFASPLALYEFTLVRKAIDLYDFHLEFYRMGKNDWLCCHLGSSRSTILNSHAFFLLWNNTCNYNTNIINIIHWNDEWIDCDCDDSVFPVIEAIKLFFVIWVQSNNRNMENSGIVIALNVIGYRNRVFLYSLNRWARRTFVFCSIFIE